MKLLFAADMSFNYMKPYATREEAVRVMQGTAALFQKADFSILNLENIFGVRNDADAIPKSGPNLISDDSYIEYLHALSPTVVGLANNHASDYGENALFHTMEALSDSGYTCIGAGKNLEDAYRPAILEKDGVRVALIAVCENEFGTATDKHAGTAGYRLSLVAYAIRKAKQNGCRPILYFHGGNEGNPFPSPEKRDLYRHFIELGAEAVIAMHTHCPQGYEYYEGKPIVYSMGNFFFPHQPPVVSSWSHGYLCELELSESVEPVLQIHPYTFDFDRHTLLQGADKEEFLRYMDAISRPIADQTRLQELFDSWCLMPSASGYIKRMATWEDRLLVDGNTAEIVDLKNLFGCEAHNELLKNTLMMIYDGRVDAAKADLEIIEKLQNMEICNTSRNRCV
ncbi:MAG: CapA family protein [Clostridia bacterium]|nr:CapA family protein [Clostridia bacterium]